jgi:rRNA maturation endonuclease Nob1
VEKNVRFIKFNQKEVKKMEAYCVKCKAKQEMADPVINQTAKGGFMAKGKCPVCGTTMCRIMSKDNAEKAIADGTAKKA